LQKSALRPPEFRGYRLAASFVEKSPFHDSAPLRTGALVGGLRVRTDASGLSLADTISEPALRGGSPVPEPLGGGVLFWNATALYTSETFLGLLHPLLDLGFAPVRASFGPKFVLLHGSAGQRVALDLRARQRVELNPKLLVDIAATADGRAVALLEGGNSALSTDAGKSYQPLSLPAGERALGVNQEGDALLVRLSSGSSLRLEKAGPPRVVNAAPQRPKKPRADALWPLPEPPLERALRFGAPLGDGFAGVAVAGAVATVNLRTGELVQMTRALVPSDLDCRALDANGSLILVCSSPAQGSIVLSDVFGERPTTQAKFPPGVRLAFADGVLLAASRCDGQAQPAAVCVRAADGRFRDFDVSARLSALSQSASATPAAAKASPAPVAISHYIPKEGWGALAVVTGPAPGLLDVQSGAFVPLAPEVPHELLDGPRGKHPGLALDWVALPDGAVRGWLGRTSVSITRDGRLEPSVYEFRTLVPAGVHALAFDKGHRAFQSADWGHTWVETLAPPGSASGNVAVTNANCSPVGCHLGPWLLVGWEPQVPGAFSRAQVVPAPPSIVPAPLPVLGCKERSGPIVSEQAGAIAAAEEQSVALAFGGKAPAAPSASGVARGFFAWATQHPIVGAGVAVGLRGEVATQLPSPLPDAGTPEKNWRGYAQTKNFSFVSAFEPSARTHSAAVSWRALFDTAAAAGAAVPNLQGNDDPSLPALPVLGRGAGQTDGLVLDDGTPVWAHEAGSAEPFALAPNDTEHTLISAVAVAPHSLAVLLADSNGSLEVREVSGGKGRRLFRIPSLDSTLYPENADALALGANGALGVLRTRSGREPASNADPAVLLDEHGEPTVLAPWSQLFLADAPECKEAPNDYRVILQTTGAWLKLVDGGVPVSADATDAGMFALLRLNASRICVEGLELAADPVQRADTEFPTRLAARFVGPGKGAARLGFAPGFELRQTLECGLSASP
jgi:hypothetical protein